MSVIGGILLFAAGAGVGGCAIGCGLMKVQQVKDTAGKQCERLRYELWETKTQSECDRAYQEGFIDGKHSPDTEAEALIRSFGGRNVGFRSAKREAKKGA